MLSEIQINIISELDRLIKREYELIALSGVITELQGLLRQSKPKKRKKVEFALRFLQEQNIRVLNEKLLPNETADEYILRVAKKTKFVVATNDVKLKKKLKDANNSVIYLRQKSYLAVDGFI
ncbi:MAG: twitching motility protein PilT, partial [Promethearchaeota archaeon]